jgi:hypothetical protein
MTSLKPLLLKFIQSQVDLEDAEALYNHLPTLSHKLKMVAAFDKYQRLLEDLSDFSEDPNFTELIRAGANLHRAIEQYEINIHENNS